jgi:hypothetical protein
MLHRQIAAPWPDIWRTYEAKEAEHGSQTILCFREARMGGCMRRMPLFTPIPERVSLSVRAKSYASRETRHLRPRLR